MEKYALVLYPSLQVSSKLLSLLIKSYILLCSPLVSPVTKGSLIYCTVTLSVLQKDGLRIWDCQTGCIFTSHPFFFLGTADGPGLAALHRQVGHHGAFGCQEYCGLRGRHKPGGPHYYPALLKPLNYALPGCDYNNINAYNLPKASSGLYTDNLNRLLQCETDVQFKSIRKDTGVCKPRLFLGHDARHSSSLPG